MAKYATIEVRVIVIFLISACCASGNVLNVCSGKPDSAGRVQSDYFLKHERTNLISAKLTRHHCIRNTVLCFFQNKI